MKTKQALLLLAFSAGFCGWETVAATLDQQYLAGTDNGLIISKSQTVAQTFQVGMTGFLDRIELQLARNAVLPPQGLTFELRSTLADGSPGSTVLASAAIGAVEIATTFQFLSINVRPFNLMVTGGDRLAALLRSEAEVQTGGIDPFAWNGTAPGGYNSGAVYFQQGSGFSFASNWDVSFQTFVDTVVVPEPSVWALSLVSVGVLLCHRTCRPLADPAGTKFQNA